MFRTKPFTAIAVLCRRVWQPVEEGPLPVEYHLHDPNARAEFGRLVYVIPPAVEEDPGLARPEPVIVHEQRLRADQITDGRHELRPSERWDGTFTQGIQDRVGTRVTAECAPLRIALQLWNGDPEPPRIGWDTHRTRRDGSHVSEVFARTYIDDIVAARWDRTWVIPYGDPEEPERGEAKMEVRVRGVADGTPARLYVERIGSPSDFGSEENKPYAWTGKTPDEQPGLEGAVVRDSRVVLRDGTPPFVRFNRYEEHWKYPGNNFYAFRVALGKRGRFHPASERDFEKRERDCLHMRFTVFINRPAGDLGHARASARKLHRFLRRRTRYYRSYLLEGGFQDPKEWIKYWRHRYIVVFAGHAACTCQHVDHPSDPKEPDEPMEMMHWAFPPDRNECPDHISPFQSGEYTAMLKKYGKGGLILGCGHKSGVSQWIGLGRKNRDERFMLYNTVGSDRRLALARLERAERAKGWREAEVIEIDEDAAPRLMFYSGGCRTMITTNFGERMVGAGTRYHCGWVYSVRDRVDGRFLPEFFQRWIKGSPEDPAATEYEIDRIPEAYKHVAKRGDAPDWHPRIMDATGVLNPKRPRYLQPDPEASDGLVSLLE